MKKLLPYKIISGLLITLFFLNCQTSEKNVAKSIDGVWKSLGYGRIVKVEAGAYLLADVTEISCIPLMEGNISDFGDKIKVQNDTISLVDGINTYFFIRLMDAPAICKKDSQEYKDAEAKANDPEYNFEVLWHTFKDHYAYFDLRNVDSDKMYAVYRPKVTAKTTEAELFFLLTEMLESFNDGHVSISATDEVEEAAMELYESNQTEEDNEEEINEAPKERFRNYQVAVEVAKKYIPEGSSAKNGNLRWGIMKNNVGYLQMNQMMGMADNGINDTLSYRDHWMAYFKKLETVENDNEDELRGIHSSLDIIMNDIADTDALIIDVRFNGGGKDEVGMAVLERINTKDRLVFTKKGKMGKGFTPVNWVMQAGSEEPYTQPVYLLIGPESASATEIMALSSLSLPNVTRVGSKTEGVFSDVLDRTLPNGWEFGLSSEVYLDLDGNNYEGIGIAPDVEIGYKRDTQKFLDRVVVGLISDGDEAIEKALGMIAVVQ